MRELRQIIVDFCEEFESKMIVKFSLFVFSKLSSEFFFYLQ